MLFKHAFPSITVNVGFITMCHRFWPLNAPSGKTVSTVKEIFGQGFSDTESFLWAKYNFCSYMPFKNNLG